MQRATSTVFCRVTKRKRLWRPRILRPGISESNCGAMFFICPHCDRGQRYCSDNCRQRSRLEQVRAASRRYQNSPEGRLGHRDRQRSYRQRIAVTAQVLPAKSVTHHGSEEGARSAILSFLSRKKSLTLSPERLRRLCPRPDRSSANSANEQGFF